MTSKAEHIVMEESLEAVHKPKQTQVEHVVMTKCLLIAVGNSLCLLQRLLATSEKK